MRVELGNERIVAAFCLKGSGGYREALVCKSKWTVERLSDARDVSIAVNIDGNSLTLFTSCAAKESRVDQRRTIRRKLRNKGIKPGTRGIKGTGRDGKVG